MTVNGDLGSELSKDGYVYYTNLYKNNEGSSIACNKENNVCGSQQNKGDSHVENCKEQKYKSCNISVPKFRNS